MVLVSPAIKQALAASSPSGDAFTLISERTQAIRTLPGLTMWLCLRAKWRAIDAALRNTECLDPLLSTVFHIRLSELLKMQCSARGTLVALAFAGLFPHCAVADNALGTIRAFIDGTEGLWHTITMTQGGKSVSTASFEQAGQHADIYLQGHLEPRFVSKGMLSVEVRYPGQFDQAAEPASVEIIYMPNGLGGQFFTTRGSTHPPMFQIVDISVWGTTGEITAAFSGKLCAAWMNRPRDPTDCKTLTGQVTSRLGVE